MFDDVGCYFLPFYWGLTEAYLHGSYIYSPAFMVFFYPFTLIPRYWYYLFHAIGCICLIKLIWSHQWWVRFIILISEFIPMLYGNIDVWITVIVLAWYPYIRRHSFLTGCIMGLCCFKPPVILLSLFVWKKVDHFSYLLGLGYFLFLNYGYFLFDIEALKAFLQASLMRKHSLGSYYLIPTHYGWFTFYYLYYLKTYPIKIQKYGCLLLCMSYLLLTRPLILWLSLL